MCYKQASPDIMGIGMDRRVFIQWLTAASSSLLISGFSSNVFAGEPGQGTALVLDKRFKRHLIELGHPESPHRMQALLDGFFRSGLLDEIVHLQPALDVVDAILRVHTDVHHRSIQYRYGFTYENVALAIGGTIAAVESVCEGRVKNAFVASRPPGHHARNSGHEEGFCYYNNIAIAARYAQYAYGIRKVLVVDWDYHHGNGTEYFFYDDPDVLFFSTHDWQAYPRTGDPAHKGKGAGLGFNINVALSCGSGDSDIIRSFETELLPVAERFKPELVLISAGFDSRKDDWLGCFEVTDSGFVELTKLCMGIADRYANGRLVSVLEGGYNPLGTASAVIRHVETLLTS